VLLYGLTLPSFRGQGLYSKVLRAAVRYATQQGVKRVFGVVEKNNHAGIRGVEKAGFKFVGVTHLRKCFGIQFSRRFRTSKV